MPVTWRFYARLRRWLRFRGDAANVLEGSEVRRRFHCLGNVLILCGTCKTFE